MSKGRTAKYIFLYKTTNTVNNKIYVGYHTTNNLDDGYIGCGVKSQAYAIAANKCLKSPFIRAVCKHGYSNFKREIVQFFDSVEEAKQKEAEIVNAEFIMRRDTYNARTGGDGGFALHPLYEKYSEIVEKFSNGRTLKSLAKEYGVGITLIRSITRFKLANVTRKIERQVDKKYGYLKDIIRFEYSNGASLEFLRREYGMDFKTIKYFVSGVEVKKKSFIAISPEKSVYQFTSFKEMEKRFGLFYAGISACLEGLTNHYKGWMFFEESEWNGEVDKPKKKVNSRHYGKKLLIQGEIVEVSSNLRDLCCKYNLKYTSINNLLNGKTQSFKEIRVI